MRTSLRFLATGSIAAIAAAAILAGVPSASAAPAGIDDDAKAALATLYKTSPAAGMLKDKARAILVFPHIVKAGFVVGAQYGEGVLLDKKGNTLGYYRSVAGSYGYQAGIQSFAYSLFFMTDDALKYLDRSDGWEIGTGPSVVIVDKGRAKSFTTTTLKDDIYAFIFGQKGLMAGVGIQGSKITKISN